MSSEDFAIWQRYKLDALKDIEFVYFDVGLGGQTEVPPGTPPQYAVMWTRNTQKRIDVLLDTGSAWRIIELKHNATGAALGRLLMYRDMWMREPPDSRPVEVYLITNRLDPDVRDTAQAIGVNYRVY
jgi:hypothetical protein